ncbi:hypothetical protein CPC08DRAFT_812637 [Agrocybe pediades]|nr:hypothetical protein CPC08DRAFT_812637 [Agrocybe pediades]
MDPSVLPLVLNFDYYNIDLSVPQQDDSNVYSAPYDSQLYDAGEPLLKLHAPVPLAGSMPQLLQPDYHDCSESSSPNQPPSGSSCTAVEDYQACDVAHLKVDERHGSPIEMGKYSVEYGHTTFPTPSELLAELAAKGLPATNDEFGSDVRTESASKARRRIMAKKIGFVPTDPDTISSHDKKRYYLECLEQYVLQLHKHFQALGVEPPNLERVAKYPGLNSKSMRTMLVHMQDTAKELNERTVIEEQRFIRLRNEVQAQSSGPGN